MTEGWSRRRTRTNTRMINRYLEPWHRTLRSNKGRESSKKDRVSSVVHKGFSIFSIVCTRRSETLSRTCPPMPPWVTLGPCVALGLFFRAVSCLVAAKIPSTEAMTGAHPHRLIRTQPVFSSFSHVSIRNISSLIRLTRTIWSNSRRARFRAAWLQIDPM